MNIRRLTGLILTIALLAGLFVCPTKATDLPGYFIEGEVNGSSFVVRVYLQNCAAYTGKVALSYDTDLLELVNGGSFYDTVRQSDYAAVTTESNDPSVLLANGRVMFAWYSLSTDGVDARSSKKEIAEIEFRFVNGASESDFKRNTIGLYYVNSTMVYGWGGSASIITTDLEAYRTNSVNENYVCNIEYDYPNCDYVPPSVYNVSVNVTDTSGNALAAKVMVDSVATYTGMGGQADFKLPDGVYGYTVSKDGYETVTGYIIVNGKDEITSVQLRSNQELANALAANLKIGYVMGDTSASVTDNLTLPAQTDYGTVSWVSSDNSVVSSNGAIYRKYDDSTVTLTAYVYVGSSVATRDFTITVKSRYTAEEKNQLLISEAKKTVSPVFAPGDSAESVTVKLTLPETAENGCSVSWKSDNEDIIDAEGNVTRAAFDSEVTLTAVIMRGGESDTKEFTVTVKGESQAVNDDYEIASRVADTIEITFAEDDNAESVRNNITLPFVGADDTVIDWTSSVPAAVTQTGGVVRQTDDTSVILTASVKHGNAIVTREFKITVKAADAIPLNPNNGSEKTIKTRNSGGNGGGGTASQADRDKIEQPEPTASPTATPEEKEETSDTAASTAVAESKKFLDLDDVPWAQTAINALTMRGIISGTSDTTYSPQNNIRRADFVMLLVKLLSIEADITDNFDDVIEGSYYYEEVSRAKSLDIISGIDDTHFNPEGYISRQDMMTMTYRALNKLGMVKMQESELKQFTDVVDISDYALESVKHLVGGGYINGDDNNRINPKSYTTRAETAVFLYNLNI